MIGALIDGAITTLEEWLEENKIEDIDPGCDTLWYERELIEAVRLGKDALKFRRWKPAEVAYTLPPRQGECRNRCFFRCPTCDHEIEFVQGLYPSFCEDCGQGLRWNLRKELGLKGNDNDKGEGSSTD